MNVSRGVHLGVVGVLVLSLLTLAGSCQPKPAGPPAAGSAADSALQARLAEGQKAYLANCAMCHGAWGLGDGPIAAQLQKEAGTQAAHLNDRERLLSLGRPAVVEVIERGGAHTGRSNLMPSWSERLPHEEIEKIAAAGAILVKTLALLESKLRPGVTTGELDAAAEKFIRSQGAEPAFKGYRGFPGSICTSPNSMVVHGIPGAYRVEEGDLISVDVGVTLNGFVADSAYTFPVGDVDDEAQRLLEVGQAALEAGIAQARAGQHVGDISAAVQRTTEGAGFSVVKSLVGHGIGRSMHEEPQIPNWGEPGRGPLLAPGMTLAIEPMINAGDPEVVVAADRWSISTGDGSLSAHFEHTVAVTETEPRILTLAEVRV